MIYRKSYSIFISRRGELDSGRTDGDGVCSRAAGCEDKNRIGAMGGDYAPAEPVKGAVDAVNARSDIQVLLVGQEDVVREELAKYTYPGDQIQVVHAEEVIETAEPPVNAIRRKKQSSIVIGMNMVKQKEADAFVSAGSSGAILVGGPGDCRSHQRH